jgi:hypothetical protein
MVILGLLCGFDWLDITVEMSQLNHKLPSRIQVAKYRQKCKDYRKQYGYLLYHSAGG